MVADIALQDVTITVGDSERALAFYRDLLGLPTRRGQVEPRAKNGSNTLIFDVGNGHTLRLCSYAEGAQPTAWQPNDLQVGYRHIGLVVQNTDKTVARLKAADVQFTLEPLDATGGVRIAFFKDPDGTLLEVVEGALTYHQVGTAVAPPRSDLPQASGPQELIFDHVAITVADLDQALRFYRDTLGFPLLGQLYFHDPRGFVITYLRAGLGVLELFSFSSPTFARSDEWDEAALGIQSAGFAVGDLHALASAMDASANGPKNAQPSSTGTSARMRGADADGNPVEFFQRS